MALFGGKLGDQFANVVEWNELDDHMFFWRWNNKELKKGSRLVLRPGQDAIFIYNGKVEGVFTEDGIYEMESDIIPFLSTLKGFKFGFNSGLRAEVLFINTKEILVKWGTKGPVFIPTPALPGGMPIRAFGTFTCAVGEYDVFIEKIAGVKDQYSVDDVKERILGELDQLLMKWIAKEGKDMFNLQINADAIGDGIASDLNTEMKNIGIDIRSFAISNFNYPEEVQRMAEKAAGQSMVGDVGRFQQVSMGDAMGNPGGSTAGDMAGMAMGMAMGQQMAANMNQMNQQNMNQRQNNQQQNMNNQQPARDQGGGVIPNFCPNCGAKTNGMNFCGNCGHKLV